MNSCRVHGTLSFWSGFWDLFMLLLVTPPYIYLVVAWYTTLPCIYHIPVVYATVMSPWLLLPPHHHDQNINEHFQTYLLKWPMWEFLWFISNNRIARLHDSSIFIFTNVFLPATAMGAKSINYVIHRILWTSIPHAVLPEKGSSQDVNRHFRRKVL